MGRLLLREVRVSGADQRIIESDRGKRLREPLLEEQKDRSLCG